MMVGAVVSFTGAVSMGAGEKRDIPDRETVNDLVNAGYVEILGEPGEEPPEEAAQEPERIPEEPAQNPEEMSQNPEEPEQEPQEETEPPEEPKQEPPEKMEPPEEPETEKEIKTVKATNVKRKADKKAGTAAGKKSDANEGK